LGRAATGILASVIGAGNLDVGRPGGLAIGRNGTHECRNGADDYEPGKEAGE